MTRPRQFSTTEHDSVDTEEAHITTDIVDVSVPTDYSTIREALQLSKIARPNQTYTITVEAGHEMSEPVTVTRGDFSHVNITTNGNEIPVQTGFPASSVFAFSRCIAPSFIDCNFDFNNQGEKGLLFGHSVGGFVDTVTLKNSPGNNIEVGTSTAELRDINLDSAGNENLRVTKSSYVHLGSTNGGLIQNAGDSNVFCSRNSNLYAHGHDLDNATTANINCARSRVVWENGNLTNAGTNSVYGRSGAEIVIISNETPANITASNEAIFGDTAYIAAQGSTLGSSAGDCVTANRSQMVLFGATFNNVASGGIIVNAQDSDVNMRNSVIDTSIEGETWLASRGGSVVKAAGMSPLISDSNIDGPTLNTVATNGIIMG